MPEDPNVPEVGLIPSVPVTDNNLFSSNCISPFQPVYTSVGRQVMSEKTPSKKAYEDAYVATEQAASTVSNTFSVAIVPIASWRGFRRRHCHPREVFRHCDGAQAEEPPLRCSIRLRGRARAGQSTSTASTSSGAQASQAQPRSMQRPSASTWPRSWPVCRLRMGSTPRLAFRNVPRPQSVTTQRWR